MNNFDIINALKVGLGTSLEKTGSSLGELEEQLANGNTEFVTEKLAGILGDIGGIAGKVTDIGGKVISEAPQLALATSLLLGTLAGGGLYGLDRHLHGQDKRLESKKLDVDRLQSITARLKNDYQV